jgi:DNA-binding transcriptional LysR family regulator
MTLVQLKHFVVLAEQGSYVQAARMLFLTQPALSRSILALEDELGGRLFDRIGRSIGLTPFGREALNRARRLVADAEDLKQIGTILHAGLSGQLRIGLSSGPGALLSVPLLLHMTEHHPQVHLQISRGNTDVLVHELREHRLDALVADVRSIRPSADLALGQTFEFTAGFLARPGHPLAMRGAEISIGDVLGFPVASTPLSDEIARMLVSRYGPQANPDDMVTLRSDETLGLVEAARRSNVIVLTIQAAAPELICLPIAPPLDARARFGLVTLAKRHESPAVRILRGQLQRWMQGFGAVEADAHTLGRPAGKPRSP